MADGSRIEWTDATWNPVTGCTKVSAGCKHCYAERVFPRAYGTRPFTQVECHPERLQQPLRWGRPRRVFVDSMSDLFHQDVPDLFIAAVFGVMAIAQRHTFQILTKRPRRMLEWFDWAGSYNPDSGKEGPSRALWEGIAEQHAPWPKSWGEEDIPVFTDEWPLSNVWLGVSVEDQATADERIPLLLETPAVKRFVSYEPALGPVDFRAIRIPKLSVRPFDALVGGGSKTSTPWRIDWVIVGGESGPGARPSHPDWFRAVRYQCALSRVPFFFKQWGEWGPDVGPHRRQMLVPADGVLPLPSESVAECLAVGCARMYRVGKKAAGRLLDGVEHNGVPA